VNVCGNAYFISVVASTGGGGVEAASEATARLGNGVKQCLL
jgi:hypothetical protein